MSATPHLLQRARRWWALKTLHTRATQLAGLIAQIEHDIQRDHDELAVLRAEFFATSARLRAAQRPLPGQRQHPPITWGL